MRKVVMPLLLCSFLVGCVSTASTFRVKEGYDTRVIQEKGVSAGTKNGSNGIQVVCFAGPRGQIIEVGWLINNPSQRSLSIEPNDVKLSDQMRELRRLEPQQVIDISYGGQIEQPPKDPFSAMGKGLAMGMTGTQTRSQEANRIYSTAFNFGKTNSERVWGSVYYSSYGVRKPLIAEITVEGESYKFEFE